MTNYYKSSSDERVSAYENWGKPGSACEYAHSDQPVTDWIFREKNKKQILKFRLLRLTVSGLKVKVGLYLRGSEVIK